MMKPSGSRWTVALTAVVGGLAAIASGAGVFLRGDLATMPFVTVRGEHVDVLTSGIYRFNGKPIAAEGVGWDAVTLFLVVPVLAFMLPALWRGALPARLATTGILAYFLYQYFEYATFLAYGPLFGIYVAIVALSLTAIVLLVGDIGLAGLGDRFTARFPRRGVIALGLFMAVLLCGMWLPMIARSFGAEVVEELSGATTLVVQAFDLGLIVPLGLFMAVSVYRRLSVGYLLASVVVVKAIALASAIVAMLLFEAVATGELAVVPIAIFGLTAVASAALAARVYNSISPAPSLPARTDGSAVPRPGRLVRSRPDATASWPRPAAEPSAGRRGDP